MADTFDCLKTALADRYTIERELGAGGMATVYLAQDVKHDRKVAVKVLRPELAAVLGAERFLQEIKVTAGLSHPNILPLFDSGKADSRTRGQSGSTPAEFLYYVMPYVQGETLRDRMNRERQLSVDDALRIAEQVAGALEYAHRRDVVHRDIKPENILFHEGVAMVADFGIALAVKTAGGERLTETGLSLGTPAYMSPEQVAGERELDGRSDIYSLACVLYEMLAGDPPFIASNPQAVLARHVTDPAPPITTVRPGVSKPVAEAIARALGKRPADRFSSVAEFAVALTTDVQESKSGVKSIAVLPFANLSADPENEFFSDGITEDIITQLSKVSSFRVISRTSVMRYKQTEKSMREIAGELGVSTVLEGSVRRVGNRLRITAQLIEAENDVHLWAETYDRELTDVFEIQSEVALCVASALQTALSPEEKARVEQRPTDNMKAYEFCLMGRHESAKRTDIGLTRAVEYLEKAVAEDPNYAAAYAALADAYHLSGIGYRANPPPDAMARARKAAIKALDLDESLPDAHTSLGHMFIYAEWDWPRAKQAFERAIALNPSHAQAHFWYSHYFVGTQDFDAAIREVEAAIELDPLSVNYAAELSVPYFYRGDFLRARELARAALEMDSTFGYGQYILALTYEREGRYDEAIPICEKALDLTGGYFFIKGSLAKLYALSGDGDRARTLCEELVQAAESNETVSPAVACVLEALGDSDEAIVWLERGFEARASMLPFISTHWMPFDRLQGHPRFVKLRHKIGAAVGLDGPLPTYPAETAQRG